MSRAPRPPSARAAGRHAVPVVGLLRLTVSASAVRRPFPARRRPGLGPPAAPVRLGCRPETPPPPPAAAVARRPAARPAPLGTAGLLGPVARQGFARQAAPPAVHEPPLARGPRSSIHAARGGEGPGERDAKWAGGPGGTLSATAEDLLSAAVAT